MLLLLIGLMIGFLGYALPAGWNWLVYGISGMFIIPVLAVALIDSFKHQESSTTGRGNTTWMCFWYIRIRKDGKTTIVLRMRGILASAFIFGCLLLFYQDLSKSDSLWPLFLWVIGSFGLFITAVAFFHNLNFHKKNG
ncbi:hypothetical protein ACFL1A_01220 [Patescibacteria group bacterium]